jgi:TRAP-type C4-dicarboxylate transport system permease large subunit
MPGQLLRINIAAVRFSRQFPGSSAATAATIGPDVGAGTDQTGLSTKTHRRCWRVRDAVLIPPSIILIVYGVATTIHCAALFVAGFAGLMLTGLFIGCQPWRSARS